MRGIASRAGRRPKAPASKHWGSRRAGRAGEPAAGDWAAHDGWCDVNVPRKDDGPLSDEEIFSLEDMKRRFRDGKQKRKREKTALTLEMAKALFEG